MLKYSAGSYLINRSVIFRSVQKNAIGIFRLKITLYLEEDAYIGAHMPMKCSILFNTSSFIF